MLNNHIETKVHKSMACLVIYTKTDLLLAHRNDNIYYRLY